MHQKLSLQDLELNGKKVLMRVDFNVPLDKEGHITDDTRIRASLPSIQYVLDQGASLILMSHLGRPKDKVVPELSLKPCAIRLSELLDRSVMMAPDCVGSEVESMAKALKQGEILLLENLRFHGGEENPEEDPHFATQLAKLGDLYVNDAFGTAHREHASTYTLPKLFPGKAATGLLMEKELEFLGEAFEDPQRPFCAIIGGAKISSKLGVIQAIIPKVDMILVGGAMAYTFLKAQGVSIGDSLYEPEYLGEAEKILKELSYTETKLLLPIDHIIAEQIEESAPIKLVTNAEGIPAGYKGVDIGPSTVQKYFFEALKDAKTIFWNGPMGVFEVEKFADGTRAIAEILAQSPALKVVGGGDSIAALQKLGLTEEIDHISTGGGASLEFIEKGSLPGVEALSNI